MDSKKANHKILHYDYIENYIWKYFKECIQIMFILKFKTFDLIC